MLFCVQRYKIIILFTLTLKNIYIKHCKNITGSQKSYDCNYSAVVMACQFFKPQTRLEQRYMEFFRVSWRSQ